MSGEMSRPYQEAKTKEDGRPEGPLSRGLQEGPGISDMLRIYGPSFSNCSPRTFLVLEPGSGGGHQIS